MAETLVKNPFCSKCGEDARPQALYCHACGGEIVDLPKEDEESVSSAWFKSEIVDDRKGREGPSAAAAELKKIDDSRESLADGGDDEEKFEDVPDDSGNAGDDAGIRGNETPPKSANVEPGNDWNLGAATAGKGKKMKSAAELRQRPKPVLTKRIEVVWEERPESPNLLFLLFGLLLALVAAGAFFLAYYLK